jgi:hypothetical protein
MQVCSVIEGASAALENFLPFSADRRFANSHINSHSVTMLYAHLQGDRIKLLYSHSPELSGRWLARAQSALPNVNRYLQMSRNQIRPVVLVQLSFTPAVHKLSTKLASHRRPRPLLSSRIRTQIIPHHYTLVRLLRQYLSRCDLMRLM